MDYYNKTPNKGHKGKANYSVDFHGNSINHSDKNSALSSKILSTPGKIVQNSSIHLWTNNSQFQMSTIKVKALPIPDIKLATDYGGDMYQGRRSMFTIPKPGTIWSVTWQDSKVKNYPWENSIRRNEIIE